ncbi:roundabout homolog 3 [Sarcoramphus papa]
MLRYLLKTLLQMNLFADSLGAEGSNSSQLLLGINRTIAALHLPGLTPGNGSHPQLEDTAPRIVEHPTDLLVSKGEPATLSCKAEGHPSPAVEWYKDGERVETDREDPRSHRTLLPGGSLFFLRILHGRRGKPDEGVYVCVARNYLGEATSRNASLEVAVLRDDFRQPPGDVVVAAGEPAVLECVPPRGHPEPSVSWKKNGARLSDKDERLTIRGGKLMLASTRKSDAGVYVCVATNVVGERDSEPAELVVFERPAFGKRPLNQAVLVEGTAEFPCEAVGDPRPAARWRKEEGEMPPGRWEVLPDNTLRITRLRAEDEGTYTCVADNSVGRSEASGTLTVHVPPQLVTGPRDQTVSPGQSVTFQCQSKGNPPPAVFWQKEGSQTLLFPGQPPHPTARFSVSPAGAITIADVQPADAGYYLCQAISVAGSVLAKARLEVEEAPAERQPPVIRRGPANRTVLPVGATARLPCRVGGADPPASVGWLKDGSTLVGAQPRASLLENGTLQITGLRVTDSGHYECVATSLVGETRWGGSLEVQGDGSDPSPPSPEPGVLPGPPSTPVVTNVTRSSVTLSWKGNEDSGATDVTSYIVEAFSQAAGGPWQTVAADVKGETHTVGGLVPDTVYLFLVRAVNAYGLSDPSDVSEPVRTQGETRRPTQQGLDPEQVQRELAQVAVHLQEPVVLPPGAVRLSWTVERQAPFVQGFRVLYRRRGGRWEEARAVRAPGERGALLTELRRGQDYEVKVRPYFHHLHGPDSAVRALRTPEAAPSAPPRAVSVAGNGTSVRISWQPPPPAEQNGVIRNYRIWCLGNESRFHINQSVEGTVLATVLRGLVPGVPYRAEVAAATGAGVGARSAPVPIHIAPPAERDAGPAGGSSVAERLAEVARQPAFIAGVGGACWVILAAFAAWLYGRRRRKKELSHFAASFAYTPTGKPIGAAGTRRGPSPPSPPPLSAVSFPAPARGSPRAAAGGGYPWLADAWRGSGAAGAAGCLGTTAERYYNEAGITRYIAQTEQFGVGAGEGPVYSTIEAGGEELRTFPRPFSQHGTPYAGGGAKGKKLGQAVKPPVVSWTELLPPPPSASELSQCAQEEEEEEEDEEEEAAGGLGTEEWYPGEDVPCAAAASSPAASSGCRSTATLTPSPRAAEDIPRLRDFDSPRLPRGPDVPLGSGCPTMVRVSHRDPAVLSPSGPAVPSCHVVINRPCHAIMVQPCRRGPDVPLGSGCPTMVQMSLRDPSVLSPSIPAVRLCPGHDPSMTLRAGRGVTSQLCRRDAAVPSRAGWDIAIQLCCHRPALPRSSGAIAIRLCRRSAGTPLPSSCGTGGQRYRCNPATRLQSSCAAIQLCSDPAVQLQPSCAAAIRLSRCYPAVLQLHHCEPACHPTPAVQLCPLQAQLCSCNPAVTLPSRCDASAHPCHCHPAVPPPHGFPLLRRPPHGASTPLRAPSPPRSPDASEGHPPRARRPPGTAKTRGETPKSRPKPKCSRYRREKQPGALSSCSAADLPPPPLPPPGETPGPSPEREPSGAERKVTHRPPRGDEVVPYGKPSGLPRGQVSGSCSTTGSVSSRGSTGSRGHGSGRSQTPGHRSEGTGHRRRPGPPFPCPSQEKR